MSFENIDAAPLGNLLQVSYTPKKKLKSKSKLSKIEYPKPPIKK